MKPARPHVIDSGTGEGRTPGDARGPESLDLTIRNPEPVDPVTQGVTVPWDLVAQDDNAASNGFWLHDAAGPRVYVAPVGEDDPEIRAVAEAIAVQLGAQPDWDRQAIHVRRIEGELRLVGLVTSGVMARAAERCAAGVAGGPVRNDLELR